MCEYERGEIQKKGKKYKRNVDKKKKKKSKRVKN